MAYFGLNYVYGPCGDRELFIDLLKLTEQGNTYFNIPGGVRNDMPEGFKDRCLRQGILKEIKRGGYIL
jgi:hypothetical protein